jgi:hypothetical protein
MELFNIPAFRFGNASRGIVLPPGRCGDGHELAPVNLVPTERGTCWRCRHCGADGAAAWRRRRTMAH